MSLTDQFRAGSDPNFIQQVQMALLAQAWTILAEDPGADNHAARVTLAHRALAGNVPVQQVAFALLAHDDTQGDGLLPSGAGTAFPLSAEQHKAQMVRMQVVDGGPVPDVDLDAGSPTPEDSDLLANLATRWDDLAAAFAPA